MDNTKWNLAFSNLLRQTDSGSWGNWTLDPTIVAGAVGYIDPDTGSFTRVTMMPNAKLVHLSSLQDWVVESSGVHKTETDINFKGGYDDPTTGNKVDTGVDVAWTFSSESSLASSASISNQVHVDDFGVLMHEQFDWLLKQAQAYNYASGNEISQGFGMITSVRQCRGAVNIGSLEAASSFSLTGSVEGVANMTGGGSANAKLGGSFKDSSSTKAIESHLFPSEKETVADGFVAIAYEFASFDGQVLLPTWVGKLDPLSITFDNAHGGTYICDVTVTYDYTDGNRTRSDTKTASISGGKSGQVTGIPLSATNLAVEIHFVSTSKSSDAKFFWRTPATTWLKGQQTIDLYGVWPWKHHASLRTT